MKHIYALADVLLVHLRDDPLFAITIPHKVFSYMAVGKPILVAVRGDAAEVVLENEAGIACEPENPAALAVAVRRMAALSREERQHMGRCGLEAARARYSRDHSLAQIEAILIKAVAYQKRRAHA
jgi:glycosyltransferase involved in cell wall biosynthesis